ncbi:MAG: tetratricopeptide repeat protein, partial [Woeseiaceae bacterium]
ANPDNLQFADGIHDDLLTRLANVKALKVISRMSVMEYRDTIKNVREIGEELGVESVLEGTVQRIGDTVRINLQLIDARSDEHIWAKSYDHQLTMENIFSVQSEISESVADALQATLSPDERVRIAAMPTSDLRAYRLYKEGKNNLYQRQLETLRAARRQFEEAIALDPDYAEAHAGLAESFMLLSINHQDIPEPEAMNLAQASVDRALQLDPSLADAHAILGLMKATIWGMSRSGPENIEAEKAFQQAIALNPNHASAYMWFASLRDDEDRTGEAIELYQEAMELDPLARIPYSNLPMVYAKRGEHAAAIDLWREAIRIHNEWPTIYQYMAVHLWGLGRLDEAYAWYAKAVELGGDQNFSGGADIGVLIDMGEYGRVRDKLERIPESVPFHAFSQGLLALMEGKYGDATDLFVNVIEGDVVPARFVYDVASNSALLAGDLATAKKYVLAADPILS